MRRFLLLAIILAAAGFAAYHYLGAGGSPPGGQIRVSGNIEVTEVEVSFKVAGRVAERPVREGEAVGAGQVVARLDTAGLERELALRRAEVQVAAAALADLLAGPRPQEVAQARAAVEQAQAFLDELRAGSRPEERAAAFAAVEAAEAEALRWSEEHKRQLLLLDNGVGTARDLEVARSADETARARVDQAREGEKLVDQGPRVEAVRRASAALAEAEARHALVVAGPRPETIAQARAVLRRTQEAQALAEVQLGYATVVSPLTGVVLSENVEPGEVVAAGTPVVTVGDLASVWLRAYVSETDLGRVQLGQRVDLTADTYPGKIYAGRLSFISSTAEFTPKAVQTQQERVKLVYRVKVTVANPDGELKAGMPADGVIRSGP